MANNNIRWGFTLAEVLIVAVMMVVLAFTIVPQLVNSGEEATASSAKFELQTLRSHIQLYKSEHHGKLPGDDLAELLVSTNSAGTTDPNDGPLVFGPYIESIPVNPFTGSNLVVEITEDPVESIDATTSGGWLYRKTDGQIWLSHPDYFNE